jgi:hypothetical protein
MESASLAAGDWFPAVLTGEVGQAPRCMQTGASLST